MNWILPTVVALATSIAAPSLANSFWPELKPFYPNAPITWTATNALPPNVMVYKTVQTNFSKTAFSNAMAMGSFRAIDITSQDKNLIVFEARQDSILVRSLKISPTQGSINYFKSQTEDSSTHGVPSYEETEKLAMDYLRRFGGDTNQIVRKAKPRTEGTRESYDKKGGQMINNVVTSRGIMLCRQIDGIELSDSFLIEFGNDSAVATLKMNWRSLKPYQRYKTARPNEITDWIKAGRAVVFPDVNGDDSVPVQAKKFTITKATPVYLSRNAQGFVFPSVDLEVVADIGSTNATTFYLNCPILSTNTIEQ